MKIQNSKYPKFWKFEIYKIYNFKIPKFQKFHIWKIQAFKGSQYIINKKKFQIAGQFRCFPINPGSKKGRRAYLIQMILLPFIPIIALIAQSCHSMASASLALQYLDDTKQQVVFPTIIFFNKKRVKKNFSPMCIFCYGSKERLENKYYILMVYVYRVRET